MPRDDSNEFGTGRRLRTKLSLLLSTRVAWKYVFVPFVARRMLDKLKPALGVPVNAKPGSVVTWIGTPIAGARMAGLLKVNENAPIVRDPVEIAFRDVL